MALDEKLISVPSRATVRLNGIGVIRLVVPDGTFIKARIYAKSGIAGNHL